MKKLVKMVLSAWCLVLGAEAGTAAELPEGYTVVDYIVAPCYSYIDTGYNANSNTCVKMDVTVQGAREYWFGAWDHDWNDDAYALGNDNTGVYAGYGDDNSGTKGSVVGNGRHTVELSNRWVKVDGEITRTMNEQSFRIENSLYLFAQNRKGKASPCVGQVDITCHGCKIYEGSDLVRDFVPCVRISDGAVGFYDLAATGADKVFYANDGTGTFAIPPDAFCTITIGDYPTMTAAYTFGDGSVTNAVSGNSFSILRGMKNVKVIFTVNQNYAIIEGDPVVELGNVESDIVFGEGNDYAVPTAVCTLGEVPYLDWDDVEKKMTNATLSATDYELVTSETTAFADGKWYVVAYDVVIDNGSNIKVNGSAHLILCDNASLTIKNVADRQAAIDVSAGGSVTNALTIYGQQNDSGVLSATGGWHGAGIGTAERSETAEGCGTVTVNGGIVTATGGFDGAGIGGGDSGAGGTVTVNGGIVTATGGFDGAGIGGGYNGAGGTVSVNGGIVTATGGQHGAGIGGGDFGDGHGKVTFGAGAWLVLAGDSAPGSEVSAEDYANDHSAAYVCIKPSLSLKIPAGTHYSYVVSNETAGAELKGVLADGTNTYMVVNGSTVKVYFTPDEGYCWDGEFDNPKNLGVIECDKVVDASEMPKVKKGLPGSEVNPWSVGENVTAYIKDRVLYLKGSGAMNDFASAADVPWADAAGKITAVMVSEDVILGKNALAGFADTMTVNGLSISFQKMVAASTDSAGPSGAISGAEFEQVQIIDGKAYLDVSVYTNSEVKAKGEGEGWGVATNGVIIVPAPGKQGFFYLMSKPAVPSNKPFVPPPLPIEQ